MSTPQPPPDQLPGLEVPTPPAGDLAAAVARSVAAAQLDARDEGTGQLAVACARAVDAAGRRGDPYAVAAAGRELRETLIRLRLDPQARHGADAGEVADFLAGLGAT